jgi:hypothetical protein
MGSSKYVHLTIKTSIPTSHWWLTPVILATQEAEIRRIKVRSQPIVRKTLSQKTLHKKERTGGLAQGVGPEFKPQFHKNKNKNPPILLTNSNVRDDPAQITARKWGFGAGGLGFQDRGEYITWKRST